MNRKQWVLLLSCCCLLLITLLLMLSLLGWIPLFSPRQTGRGNPLHSTTVPTMLTTLFTTLPTQPPTEPTADAVLSPDPLPYARLGAWDGHVALFPPAEDIPTQVYDTQLASLPPAEQQRLEQFVNVWDEAELAQILEDYTS